MIINYLNDDKNSNRNKNYNSNDNDIIYHFCYSYMSIFVLVFLISWNYHSYELATCSLWPKYLYY